MKQLAITIMEVDNNECPNVGTIVGVNSIELMKKARRAITNHFDARLTSIKFQDDLGIMDVKNSPPIDVYVTLDTGTDNVEYTLEFHQTYIY
jgi:hypothetical protein